MKNIWILVYGIMLQGIGLDLMRYDLGLLAGMCIPTGTILIAIALRKVVKGGRK